MKAAFLTASHKVAAAEHRELRMEKNMKDAYLEVNRKLAEIDQLSKKLSQEQEAVHLLNKEVIALSLKLESYKPVQDAKGRFVSKKQLQS